MSTETNLKPPFEFKFVWTADDVKQVNFGTWIFSIYWPTVRFNLIGCCLFTLFCVSYFYQDSSWSEMFNSLAMKFLFMVSVVGTMLLIAFLIGKIFEYLTTEEEKRTLQELEDFPDISIQYYIDQRGIAAIIERNLELTTWWVIEKVEISGTTVRFMGDCHMERSILKRFFTSDEQCETFLHWANQQIQQAKQRPQMREEDWKHWVEDLAHLKEFSLPFNQGIRLSYQPTLKELYVKNFDSRVSQLPIIIAGAGSIACGLAWWNAYETSPVLTSIQWISGIACLYIACCAATSLDLAWASYCKWFRQDAWKTCFDENGRTTFNSIQLIQIAWDSTEFIGATPDVITIKESEDSVHYIPRSSFKSDEDYHQVVSWIKAKVSEFETTES